MSDGLKTSFLGALQASLSVLLTIGYGVIAAQFDLLKGPATKQISTVCVRMFLPALLITNVGSQLHADTGIRYVPILIWSLAYTLLSMLLGFVTTRIFKFPSWVTPALCFNNTTALPLLLIQSLESTGILDKLLISDTDTSSAALARANSYFLVNAIVGNSLTFALGPKLLDAEESPEEEEGQNKSKADDNERSGNGPQDAEQGNQPNGHAENHPDGEDPTEQTSLLPDPVVRGGEEAGRTSFRQGKKGWDKLPKWAQSFLDFLYAFLNAPLIGAIIGVTIGLVPPLHKAFFSEPQEGGIFTAWLTSSTKSIGQLFAALQVVVVGVKLSSSLRKMKKGEDNGKVPWVPATFILFTRFIIWPVISIAVIYGISARTNWLTDDPILWFTMMLMPTGPPAMKLTSLADVNGSNEQEKMSIAKFLTISYAISPLICFAVVGSLKAVQVVMGSS